MPLRPPPRSCPRADLAMAWLLACALCACDWLRSGPGDRDALVLVDVKIAPAVTAFDRIRFSIPESAVSPREVERRDQTDFRFGYYVPDGRGSVLIKAEALRAGCLVGQGMHQSKPLVPGQSVDSGDLIITAAPMPCTTGSPSRGELPEGVVIDGPGPEDRDEQNSTTTMSAAWTGFSGSITGYEYKIATAADCSGRPVHGPVNLPAGSRMHMATGLTLPEGAVFNCVRSFDHAGHFSIWKASDGITIDLVPPTVVEYRPAADSGGLERSGPVLVVFSEPLDPASVGNGNVELTALGAAVALRTELTEGGKTLALRPESPLPLLAPVKVAIAPGLRDRAGNALMRADSASFTTRDGKWIDFQRVATQDRNDVGQLERELALALAVEPGGRAVLAWEEPRTAPKATWIHVVRHEPAQGWSSAHQIDTQRPTRANEVEVAIKATGDAAVVYAQDHGATDDSARSGFASLFDPALRSWVEPAQPLSGERAGSVFGPRAAYAPTGELHVSWAWFDPKLGRGHVEGRRATGSAWTAPTAIGPTGPSGPGVVMRFPGSLAFDAMGLGHLAIAEMAGPSLDLTPTSGSVSVVTHTPNGWTSPIKVSGTAAGAPSGEPRLGIDGAGNAAVLWPQGGDASILHAAHRDQTTDQWSPPILPAGIDPLYNVHLAMNTAGNAIVLYNDRHTGIRLRRFQRGVWAKEVRVREDALLAEGVGVDARGLALAIWREGPPFSPMARILVARETAAGGLAPPVQLNKEPTYGPARLAVLPDGRAFAAWVEGTPLKLMVARFE